MVAYHELYAGFFALKTEKVTQTKLATVFSVELHLCMEEYCWRDSE